MTMESAREAQGEGFAGGPTGLRRLTPSLLRADRTAEDFERNSRFRHRGDSFRVRHPPQSGWLDGLGRLKGGRWLYLGVARCAPLFTVQN